MTFNIYSGIVLTEDPAYVIAALTSMRVFVHTC